MDADERARLLAQIDQANRVCMEDDVAEACEEFVKAATVLCERMIDHGIVPEDAIGGVAGACTTALVALLLADA